ncbi:hypothetical protein GCM10025865_05450 [Paraoerskovia sediminicola]|uniref:Solute:sodium symporter small subunit n=1 Tax=Paraoerskovia sediminicola TaxID=1138587 RepID=A0ABN6X909_9CELL|nr:hypothetical protein [Paraoerskovia sediminicola]BDZ41246.1 hypothetical protein GCM10025865_05450 [Paraoerskovia sediminicola]
MSDDERPQVPDPVDHALRPFVVAFWTMVVLGAGFVGLARFAPDTLDAIGGFVPFIVVCAVMFIGSAVMYVVRSSRLRAHDDTAEGDTPDRG